MEDEEKKQTCRETYRFDVLCQGRDEVRMFDLQLLRRVDNLSHISAGLNTSESESGFIGQVSLHKQGIWLGKVALSVLTQNIHHKTKQYKQCNSATV